MSGAEIKKRVQQGELDYSSSKVSQQQVDAARRVVAGSAADADDARSLLEHLGLMPNQDGWYSDGSDAQK